MSHGKQFTLFTHLFAPNGAKVAFILEELGLTYEPIYLDFFKNEQKAPSHTKYNPNGRIPTIIDHHNGDYAVWESNAILLYLVDLYDKEKRLTASGQGPYYGQSVWFRRIHPEKIPSAIKRYRDETKRVISVLDGVIAASPSGYLVGGKLTIADLSFIPWNHIAIKFILPEDDLEKEFPRSLRAWHSKLEARPVVKKILAFGDAERQESLPKMDAAAAELAKAQN